MRIGTSTRVVGHLPTLRAVDLIADTGLEHIELWTEYPHLCLDLIRDDEVEAIENRIRDRGLTVSIHAPIRDVNLSSLNPGMRTESVRQVQTAVRFAAKLEAPIVVIHPGKNSSAKDPFEWTEKVFYESLHDVVKVAEEHGVTLAMENMEERRGEYVTTAGSLVRVIETIRSPHLKATFDIAHAHTVTRDLATFYAELQGHVVHIHVSDNSGPGGRTHAAIGEGDVCFHELFRQLYGTGYAGALVIEGYNPSDPEATMRRNLTKLRKILEEALG